MTTMRIFMLLLMTTTGSNCLAAENRIETSQSLANTLAYISTIEKVCSLYFDIDRDLTKKVSLNIFAKAIPLYGVEYFQRRAIEEFIILSRKYEKIGPKDWCAEERGLTLQMGFKFFR